MKSALTGLLLGAWCSLTLGEGIYTCVDSRGRRFTADRPIVECLDREQKELNPSGSVRRRLGPSLTADERAAEEDKNRKMLEERIAAGEEKRRDRALLTRYPNKASHDKERVAAISLIDDVIATAVKHSGELALQRKALDIEAEFFKSDPARVPAQLKRQIEENDQSQAAQKRFVADQAGEKQRVNNRFDDELVRLRQLWGQLAVPVTAASPATPRK